MSIATRSSRLTAAAFSAAFALAFTTSGAQDRPQERPQEKPQVSQERQWGSWESSRADALNTGRSNSATDATKGKIKWTFLGIEGMAQVPVVKDGALFVGDKAGNFYGIDALTGKRIWQARPQAPDPQGYIFSGPVIAGDYVVAASQPGAVTAYRRADGKVMWETIIPGEIFSSLRFARGKVLFGSMNCTFYALNGLTGKIEWTYDAGDGIGSSPAILSSGKIIVPSHDKYIHWISIDDGKPVKKWNLGYRSTGSPLIANGNLYLCTTGRKLRCLSFTGGGAERWTAETMNVHQQGFGIWERNVMVHIGKYLFAFDANTGDQRWRSTLGESGACHPCVGRELVYASDAGGNVKAFDLKTGIERWHVPTTKGSISSPILVDGLVYYVTANGAILAIE